MNTSHCNGIHGENPEERGIAVVIQHHQHPPGCSKEQEIPDKVREWSTGTQHPAENLPDNTGILYIFKQNGPQDKFPPNNYFRNALGILQGTAQPSMGEAQPTFNGKNGETEFPG